VLPRFSGTMLKPTMLTRLDHGDRALFLRWVIDAATPARARAAWTALTHLGGLRASIAAVLVPAALGDALLRTTALQAAWALALSHVFVQIVKRKVVRERPSLRTASGEFVAVPDRFSFPSGHSAAAMSVAFTFAMAYPALATPLILLSALVGFSRVRLGVHYPGDVLAGQFLAILTALSVVRLW
jgi:undecaprenyl-diphosphatase